MEKVVAHISLSVRSGQIWLAKKEAECEIHSTVLQSPQQRRLGCGSDGKVPIGYDTEGKPIRNEKGEIIYIQGCTKTQQGLQYTKFRKINGFGRYVNQSGGLNDPQKGGLVVRNF